MQSLLQSVFGLLLTVLGCAMAHSAVLQVAPVKIDFSPQQNAAGIGLTNPGDEPIYGQVRVYHWDQNSGGDVLTPAKDVVASPPMIKVAAHGQQFIRLVRVDHQEAPVEQSYRLLIDEIVPPDAPQVQGIAIRMRYSIPVFIAAKAGNTEPQLDWRVRWHDNQWQLSVDNRGSSHAQVGALSLITAKGEDIVVSEGLLGYALPGRARQWPLPIKTAQGLSGPLQIKVNLNGRAYTFNVVAQS